MTRKKKVEAKTIEEEEPVEDEPVAGEPAGLEELSDKLEQVEYLIAYEGNAFAFTGNVEQDLLSITAVHPMREDAVHEFLLRAEADWSIVYGLIAQDQLVETGYRGHKFYMRRLNKGYKIR